jgi:hypothetical protein
MSEPKFKIKQRVIIAGLHTGVIMARVQGNPDNIYRVDAFFENHSGWYPEIQLEADPIQQYSATDVADATIDIAEMKKSIDLMTELSQENQRLKEALNTAAGLLFRLERYNCIQTEDELFDGHLDHWREIGRWVVSHSQKLLNTQFNAGIDQ